MSTDDVEDHKLVDDLDFSPHRLSIEVRIPFLHRQEWKEMESGEKSRGEDLWLTSTSVETETLTLSALRCGALVVVVGICAGIEIAGLSEPSWIWMIRIKSASKHS